jgi:O-antigen ligase
MGFILAISISLIFIIILTRKWPLRLLLITAASIGLIFAFMLNSKSSSIIAKDFELTDKNGKDLKQRYIEWQAEINLLKQRTATGTAAGCINDQRSNFYFRLPKLNTLLPFDQNGFLAAAAETGILGLVCFCWIIIHYGKSAFTQTFNKISQKIIPLNRYAKANLAGFIGACVANIFSSVHYNGVLIAFVLLLALISANQQLMKES